MSDQILIQTVWLRWYFWEIFEKVNSEKKNPADDENHEYF